MGLTGKESNNSAFVLPGINQFYTETHADLVNNNTR